MWRWIATGGLLAGGLNHFEDYQRALGAKKAEKDDEGAII
jgi:hypothetical protein